MSESRILNSVRARLWRNNQNWIACIVGPPGSGKSWAALSIADYIDSNFTIGNVFFNIPDFLKAISDGSLKRGSMAVIDEAGIQWGSRDFMTRESKYLSYLFQVMRYKNFGVIMTVPSLFMIDRVGRDLLSMLFETKGIDRKKRTCMLAPKLATVNKITGHPYLKWPRIRNEEGRIQKVTILRVGAPRGELCKAYEKHKEEFADNLMAHIHERLEKKEKKPKEKAVPNTRCMKCKYEWFTKSISNKPSCPRCHSSVTGKLPVVVGEA